MMRLRAAFAALLALVAASAAPAAAAAADDEAAARGVFVAAMQLLDAAEAEADRIVQFSMMAEAFYAFGQVREEYPGTALARMLEMGQPIGRFDPAGLWARYVEDIQRVMTEGIYAEWPDWSATTPVGPPGYAGSIPIARDAPSELAGRVLLGLAEWLEGIVGARGFGPRLTVGAPLSTVLGDDEVVINADDLRLYPARERDFFHLGDLAVSVIRRDDDDYGFSFLLPRALRMLDRSGQHEVRLNAGQGGAFGFWRSDLGLTTLFQLTALDVALFARNFAEVTKVGSVGKFMVRQRVVERAPGKWSGGITVKFEDLAFAVDQSEGQRIGAFSMTGAVRGFTQAGARSFLDELMSLARAVEAGESARLEWLLDAVIGFGWSTADIELSVRDFSHSDPRGPIVSFSDLQMRVDVDGQYGSRDVWFDVALFGLAGGSSIRAELPPALMPHDVLARGAVRYLRELEMLGILRDAAAADGSAGSSSPPGSAFALILENLVRRDSVIEVEALELTGALYALKASGDFAPSLTSPLGVVGRATVTVEGLDALATLASNDPDDAEGLREILPLLIFLQGIAEPADVPGAHRFALAIPESGAVTLNGKPIESLLGR